MRLKAMGRIAVATCATACAMAVIPALAQAEVLAGAAKVDASWHVGAAAGQYASDCAAGPVEGQDPSQGCGAGIDPANDNYDPTAHSTRRRSSYGMQSRLEARALVVDDGPGNPVAIVKTDLYIPQDLLYRRAAQLLEASDKDCAAQGGITRETLTMAVTHNHSSPFYSSTAWGVWAFQDVFDVRFYNYMADRIFKAVVDACNDDPKTPENDGLVPVRVGASVGYFDKTHRHSFGPATADDGTPAGYPQSETDHDMTVIRFDDVSDPANPRPLANLVNFSLHPEFLDGNDLISADYIGPLERMTDRATGAITVWTQGAVGTSEPERSTFHSIHERLEFSHKEYAQSEYGARLMSDSIIDVWNDVAAGTPEQADRYVPLSTSFPVEMQDRWYPGPFSHPYPGVSNCRSDKGLEGNPQLPVAGLPTCQGTGQNLQQALLNFSGGLGLPTESVNVPGTDPGLNTDDFQQLGIPVPENYSAPSYTGLEEDIDIHLQGIRLGEIYLPVCSCEQWFDQSKNIETRTDEVVGNEWLGYDWGAQCTDNGNGTHSCPNPHDPTNASARLTVTDHEYERMRAQVNNPANGWNNAENAAYAESESNNTAACPDPLPAPPTPATPPNCIWGNYTHDDNQASADRGYTMTVPISMANDYNGYIATYREYQRGDHYRKALTGWGPHSSDYMASRLVTIGRELNGASPDARPTDQKQEALLAAKAEADTRLNDQRATALGEAGGRATEQYENRLPNDGGKAEGVAQPKTIERFGAAFFTWNGGSNYTDNPEVRVQRRVGNGWETYADQSGEIPVTLKFPKASGDQPAYLSGNQRWHWTAHFEAFVSGAGTKPFDPGARPIATPADTYRFKVDGRRREGGEAKKYDLTSERFEVRRWSGIKVRDLRREDDGTVSFQVGPRSTYTVGGSDSQVDVEGGDDPAIQSEIGPIDYPDSYKNGARFINDRRTAYRDPAAPGDPSLLEWFCLHCSFRPWLDSGNATTAEVTFVRPSGRSKAAPARLVGDRWVTEERLAADETALVARGCVRDRYENFNGSSESIGGSAVPDDAPKCQVRAPDEGGDGKDGGGSKRPRCAGRRPTIVGTNRGERIAGTAGRDVILARRGGDEVAGRDGRDLICAGGGTDIARGGAGSDRIFGNKGNDRLLGNRDRDSLYGNTGDDRLAGSRGADFLHGDKGDDKLKGNGGSNVLRGGEGSDRCRGGPVQDLISGCELPR